MSDAAANPLREDGLDARILRAELDLIAREERVRGLLDELGERWERARQPARWLAPLAGAGVLLALLLWGRRRLAQRRAPAHRRRDHGGAAAPAAGAAPRSGRWPLLHGLSLVWPLLPGHWRSRWGAGADALFHVGDALARRWMGRSAAQGGEAMPHVRAVAHVDLGRYAGTWFEIARLPAAGERACAGQPEARYEALGQGRLRVRNRCRQADGRWRQVQGEVRAVPGGGGALRVSFLPRGLRWLPGAWADYWVLHLDADYSVALVGDPGRRHLWLLARRPVIARDTLAGLLAQAQRQGFEIERLVASA